MLDEGGRFMQSSLLFSDSKNFIDKYTRFMTKDIYISLDMEKKFLDEYKYLFDEFIKNKYLYQGQDIYKKLSQIYNHSDELLRLHNQKYLKKTVSNMDDFFYKVSSKDNIDSNMKMMVLSLEDKMVSVIREQYVDFIGMKLLYMKRYLNKDMNRIQVICCDDGDLNLVKKELEMCDLSEVSLASISNLKKGVLKKEESIVNWDNLYQELFQYIVFSLFKDKEYFKKICKNFSYCIYLNRDYKDFDTFKDYHYYMYKRKYLDSKLSVKKFNEREIKIRRGQLRTIDNVFLSSKEMVDVGNFLYLNSVDFTYNKDKDCFISSSKDTHHVITFSDEDIKIHNYEVIHLDKDKKYLGQLVYELLKRQYGMEKRDSDEVFSMLRDTSMDSYFSEFIRECLIPSMEYYSEYKSFDNTRYNNSQREILIQFYEYFLKIKKEHSYVDKKEVHDRVQKEIDNSKYDYYIILGECDYKFKSYLLILKDYPSLEIVKDYVKLSYQYRSYLNENKKLFVKDCFCDMEEIKNLKNRFLIQYMDFFNKQIISNKKEIYICFYDDRERLKVGESLCRSVYSILLPVKNRDISFLFLDKGEIKKLVGYDCFYKSGTYQLESDIGKFNCYSLYTYKKSDLVLLPFLIKDQYHMNMLSVNDVYQVKVGIYLAMDKCKDGVYIMCPYSRRSDYMKVFDGLSCRYFKIG